jgi:hypothetical protein
VSFLNEKLQVNISGDDIEAAHTLPTRVETSDNTASSSSSSSGRSTIQCPAIIVRFRRRELRDNILRKRRLLKQSQFALVEDLTLLNSRTLSRVSKDPAVATAWTWNGKIIVLKKTGEKVTIRPFQSVQ